MDTLISNVTVVTMNPRMDVLFGAYIAIEDGKILSIEKTAPEDKPRTIIDGTGMVAIPGLINCHTQLATASLRSYTDDLTGTEALETLLKKECGGQEGFETKLMEILDANGIEVIILAEGRFSTMGC